MKATTQLLFFLSLLFFSFQQKHSPSGDKSPLASAYTSEVMIQWMNMQVRLMSTTPAVFNGPFVRIYSYSSIVAYESVFPGITNNSNFWFPGGKLNRLPSLPNLIAGKKYNWPSSLNAAMAYINRMMFPAASIENKTAIDSLENEVKKNISKNVDASTIERSVNYGLSVAKEIFNWSESDGYHNGGNSVVPPTGPGKWKPTPPNYSRPIEPFWGTLRPMVIGSTEQAEAPAPIPYSEDSTSAFYKAANEVYKISLNMTNEQRQVALYWKEINPGFTAPGHWLNILRQLLQKEKATLDKAVFSYALTGIALNDAWISSWKFRYVHNVLRPVTYIREVIGDQNWLSFVATPPHPEYTSGFAAMAGALCGMLSRVFGEDYQFTDSSYVDAGLGTRTFYSFSALAKEAGDSKIYGGIHYRFSVDAGLQQGKKVAENVATIITTN